MNKAKLIMGGFLLLTLTQSCGVINVMKKKLQKKKDNYINYTALYQDKTPTQIQNNANNAYEKLLLDSIQKLQNRLNNPAIILTAKQPKPSKKKQAFWVPIKNRFVKSADPITKPYSNIVFEKSNAETTQYTYRNDTLVVSMSQEKINELMLETLKNKTSGFAIQQTTKKDSILKTVELINNKPTIKYDTIASTTANNTTIIKAPETPVVSTSESVLIGDVAFDTDPSATLITNEQNLIDFIKTNSHQYTTFMCNASIHYKTEDKAQTLKTQFRLKQDSVTWASANFSIFGEVMRALILKDSAKAVDKFNQKAYAFASQDLEKLTNLPLQFGALQNFIVGNPPIVNGQKIIAKKRSTGMAIRLINNDITTILNYNADNTLHTVVMYGTINNKNISFKTTYADYEKTATGTMAMSRKMILLNNKKETQIDMDIKNYTLNDTLEFPYRVSDKIKTLNNEKIK